MTIRSGMKHEESSADKVGRVKGMASGSQTWDLSEKDIAALKYVLEALENSRNEALEEAAKIADDYDRDATSMDVASVIRAAKTKGPEL